VYIVSTYHKITYMTTIETQTERIQLRVSASEKRLLQEAALASKKTLSEFILEKSVIEAEIALSQRTRFVLDSERWSKFIDLLERPVTTKPALKKLLKEPSVLER
jgi:uncharacterized protein (DUF1778 family)